MAWSDPTGSTATDHERVKANMRQAAGSLRRIRNQLEFGLESLGRVFSDRGTHFDRPAALVDVGSTVTRADLAGYREAQRRRQGRGEDFGEG